MDMKFLGPGIYVFSGFSHSNAAIASGLSTEMIQTLKCVSHWFATVVSLISNKSGSPVQLDRADNAKVM